MKNGFLNGCFRKTLYWIVFTAALYLCFYKLFPCDVQTQNSLWIGAIAGVMALLFALLKIRNISYQDSGDENMKKIANIKFFFGLYF